MRPEPGTVLHFSEDPNIPDFAPHVARTAQVLEAYVWAVDANPAPDYWFPRECPRAMAWPEETTTEADRLAMLGATATRVHLIEYGWLPRMLTVRLFAYRFDAAEFSPHGEGPRPVAQVATRPVRPLGPPEPVGDLLALHAEAGIELRLADTLWPWWDTVTGSTVGFSGIRLRNARGSAEHVSFHTPPLKG